MQQRRWWKTLGEVEGPTPADNIYSGNIGPLNSSGLLGTFHLVLTHLKIRIIATVLSNKDELLDQDHCLLWMWMHSTQLSLKILFESCLSNLEKFLGRYVMANLVLDWDKCYFMVKKGIILENLISLKGIEVNKANIEIIEKLSPPASVREVGSFQRHVGFYNQFIKYLSKISKPLTTLLTKDMEFNFDKHCLESFQHLKQVLISAPII